MKGENLKNHIILFCTDCGADLLSFASVERWDEYGEVPPDFHQERM